jgi:transcriptional regulator with XRE-family HTH domain
VVAICYQVLASFGVEACVNFVDHDEHIRRQLRTLQRMAGGPTDAALARRSGVAAATFSEVMAGKRPPRPAFVSKIVAGCLAYARASGHAPLDEDRVLQALRLPGHTAADAGILERDDELTRCSAALDVVEAGVGATMIVEGPAGIGKSEMLRRVCAEAAVRGIVPLAARGSERDRGIAFGAARTLLTRWVAELGKRGQSLLFADAAAPARVPLGMLPSARTDPGTMIGHAEALYWLVVNATSLLASDDRGAALLLAVDDAHWLDEESLRWLGFLSDRLAGLPVLLVLAYRPHEPRPAPALARIALGANEIIRPNPLSHEAVRILVGRALSRPGSRPGPDLRPDDRFCAAVFDHTGGNPIHLRRVLDLARERRLAPTATAAQQVGELVPPLLIEYLNQRLAGLGPAARHLARAAAVFGRGCSLRHVARLTGLDLGEAKRGYDRLCQAGILTAGPTVEFQHPVVRGAIYDGIDPSERSDAHLAAARLLHDQQAGPDAVATHLLRVHTSGDSWVAHTLCEAAEEALRSGLSGMAARYLKRAVDEPPPAAHRYQVMRRYGQATGARATAVS